MDKITEILIGTNNEGKYREICDLLPKNIKKYSPKKFSIPSPEENGKSFEENSFIKASYFSKKTNLICLSDDSGLEIDILKGQPGIFSARWSGEKNNFNLAIEKVYKKMEKISINWQNKSNAKFICCMNLFWPTGKNFSSRGEIEGNIAGSKKGKNGFGYDPIFIPKGHIKTFGEMEHKLKISIDHRFKAYMNLKKFFNQD